MYYPMLPNENIQAWGMLNYQVFIRVNQASSASVLFDFKGERVFIHAIAVHHTFLKVMGIEITEGRDFREDDSELPNGVWILNETARKKYKVEIGDIFQREVIGIMPDLKYASFRVAVEPMAFHVIKGYPTDYAYIQVKAGVDKRTALSHVRAALSELEPNYPFFEIRFFDEVLQPKLAYGE